MNIQDWFPLGWTGWISLQSKGLSRVFSNITVQKHQLFSIQLFFLVQLSHPSMATGKTITLTRWTFVAKVMPLLFNMLSRLVITKVTPIKKFKNRWWFPISLSSSVTTQKDRGSSLPCPGRWEPWIFVWGLRVTDSPLPAAESYCFEGFCYFWGSRWDLILISWQPPTSSLTPASARIGTLQSAALPPILLTSTHWRHMGRSLPMHVIVPCI